MKKFDYIIAGSGLSGLMTAYKMSLDLFYDSKNVLIIDKYSPLNYNKTWCYWSKEIDEWNFLISKKWSKIIFKNNIDTLKFNINPYEYKLIKSDDFFHFVLSHLQKKSNFYFVYDTITEYKENSKGVSVQCIKEKYYCDYFINSILNINILTNQKRYPYLKQHFIGWYIKTENEIFDDSSATFMDFSIHQSNNTRFMYVLPIDSKTALFEYTLFSKDLLPVEEYEKGIKNYLHNLGIDNYNIIEKEKGNIPMTCYPFQKHNTARIINIGSAGGWTKPSTGYTFYNTNKKSAELVDFLKFNIDLKYFNYKNRFDFYDKIFIEVLFRNNHLGKSIFSSMFKKIKIHQIFNFLNNQSKLSTEIRIIKSVPKLPFIKALITYNYKHYFSKY